MNQIMRLPTRLGVALVLSALLTKTAVAAESNHAAFLVLQELARINKCTEACPELAKSIFLAKQARCSTENESITCAEPNGKWHAAIDRAQFKNSLGKTVLLRIDITLPADEFRSIADLRKEYFSDWDDAIIAPPEHVLRPSNAIQLLGHKIGKHIFFGQTKKMQDNSVNSAIIAITAN